jgi:hypothetical protein
MTRLDTFARFDEDIPEPTVIASCAWCGRDIYVGEYVKRTVSHGTLVHSDECAREYAETYAFEESGAIQADGSIY